MMFDIRIESTLIKLFNKIFRLIFIKFVDIFLKFILVTSKINYDWQIKKGVFLYKC